jgi:hypothetical protein
MPVRHSRSWNADSPPASPGLGRRSFLHAGLGAAAAGAAGLWLPACAMPMQSAAPPEMGRPRNRAIEALDAIDPLNGGADPFPIPWLDRNGSHNQAPGPGMEPSNIFHFRGRVARANGFTGMGTDNAGRRLAFGANSTDYSFMDGEYFAGRESRRGAFGHI